MSNKRGKSLCVFSAKGGVGKSITVLNLAGVFASLDKKVLIIDMDNTGGAIATYLNLEVHKTVFNIVDDYANNRFQSIDNYVTKYNDNISIIAASKDPRQGARINPSYIEIILEKATNNYDIVLVDTNHPLSEFNVTLLDNVDEILLIVTNDLLDLKNMHNIIQIFHDADKSNYKVLLNNAVNPYKKYYTMYDIKNMIKSNIDYVIENKFFLKTIDNYIVDGIILTEERKMSKSFPKVYKAYMQIYLDLMETDHEK